MHLNKYWLACATSALFLSLLGCRSAARLDRENTAIDGKMAPYEHFALQRSWPDPVFDWQAWHRAVAREKQRQDAVSERGAADCSGIKTGWTLQGPGNVAGRVNTLAVQPDNDNVVLAGFSGGGIFRSADGGVNWTPVFDDHAELSIGHIVFDPASPGVAYAGTGDPNMPAQVFNGAGLFKSTDYGKTWKYLALADVGVISKVAVDPFDPMTIYVASMGNPFVRDMKRGVWKTSDGGKNWQNILHVSNQAGASDLIVSWKDPKVIYASFWDRVRNNKESIVYGPNAKIFKSVNGGETWTPLAGGLPNRTMGRTGLAISREDHNKLYAVFVDTLHRPGGLFKTVDGGATWTGVGLGSLANAYADFGWYFGKVRVHPLEDEEVYFPAISLWRKAAGSTAWFIAAGGHADSHDLVFTPSGRRYWANDGGVYRNDPGSNIWVKSVNLPTTQFYRATFNPHQPHTYWAGAQDNGIQKGNASKFNNWSNVFSADGFRSAFHPTDSNTFWVEIQNGNIQRTNNGGQNWQFGTDAFGTGDRCNWDAPFFISKHAPYRMYAATYRVYSGGLSGGLAISSPDLTDGNIYGAPFHTISCLEESPLTPDALMAGTTDGNVWRYDPVGAQWHNITAGLPDRYVTSVAFSAAQPGRLYATHSGYRANDNTPHIHRSDDLGAHWVDISGNLPPLPINDLLIPPGHADSVIMVATDIGVYFTKNGGALWLRLGSNMPSIAVFDLEHNPVRKEVLAATFARSLWSFPLDSLLQQKTDVPLKISGQIATETGKNVPKTVFSGFPVTSATNGQYTLDVQGCQTLRLAPYRNDAPLNGVTTMDLSIIAQHLLGQTPLATPYKIIAADANRSRTLTALDIVQLRRLILGLDTALVNNTSWRFIPAARTFPDPQNPLATPISDTLLLTLETEAPGPINFIAVKIGDVNDSADPALAGAAEDRSKGFWPIGVAIAPDASGALTAEVQGDLSDIAGVQFSLRFDASQMTLTEVKPAVEGLSDAHFNIENSAAGRISVCFEPNEREQGTKGQRTLFRLYFKPAKTDLRPTDLYVSDAPTYAVAYRSDGTPLRPLVADALGADWRAFPNPFDASGLQVALPPMEQAGELSVFDARGVLTHRRVLAVSGENQIIHLPGDIFKEKGVYIIEIRSGGLRRAQKATRL